MKQSIKICAMILLLSSLFLTGCGPDTPPDFAQVYVRGILDTLYLGEYSEDFLSVTDTKDPAVLEAEYETGLETETNYFAYYFGIDELTDTEKEHVLDMYRELYQLARYEVHPSVAGENSYTVDVTVEPLDVISRVVAEDLDAFAAEQKAASSGDMTEEEYQERYVQGLVALIQAKMNEPGYHEPVTLTVEVTEDPEDGLYYLQGNGLAEIDEQIIRY